MKQLKLTFLLTLLMSIAGVKTLAYDAKIDDIYYNFSGANAIVTYYSSPSSSNQTAYTGDIVIPETVYYNGNTYTVISIGNNAFSGCAGLTSVDIPNSITYICSSAFYGCSSLKSVTIPNSVTGISDYAFYGCSGLTSVTIPNSVTSIGDSAFRDCSSMTSVTIPNSVTRIGYYAFRNCSSLTSVIIPNSVTGISAYAFYGCTGLTSVTIPNSVTGIYDSAFYGCSGLTSVTIPNSVTLIYNSAFYGCSGLTSVIIPNSVTSIGSWAFWGCSSLTSVEIPNSVTSIGNEAFAGCSGMTSISVASDNTIYDSRNNCNAIIETASNTLITGCNNTIIPNSVTSIGYSAFYNCSSLTSVTIGNSVMNIGYQAFYGCSGLTSVEIPNSVTSIGSQAFRHCSSLTSVTVGWETPVNIDSYTFSNRSDVTLYVPYGCAAAYQAAPYWKEFKEIVEMSAPATSVTIKMGTASRDLEALGYSSAYGLDFTDITKVKAYIASGYTSKQKVLLSRVYIVPPYTGIYLKTTEPGCEVEVPTTDEDVYYANLLQPLVEAQPVQPKTTINGEEFLNFVVGILDKDDPDDPDVVGFIRLKKTSTVGPNRCVLPVPSRLYSMPNSVRNIDVVFDDEATGVEEIEDIDHSSMNIDHYYDLQGRKVTQPKNGLYIVNGKKVVIK